MPYVSSSKIILRQLHVDNNEGEYGIGYDMIIGHDLMDQLGLLDGFNNQVLQCYGATASMK